MSEQAEMWLDRIGRTITERVDVDKLARTITRLADIEREANANAYRAAKIKAGLAALKAGRL